MNTFNNLYPTLSFESPFLQKSLRLERQYFLENYSIILDQKDTLSTSYTDYESKVSALFISKVLNYLSTDRQVELLTSKILKIATHQDIKELKSTKNFIAISDYANALSMNIDKFIEIDCPFKDILLFFEEKLEKGLYFLPLGKEALGIVKENYGGIEIFDPSKNSIYDLNTIQGMHHFKTILKKAYVHIEERLLLYKVTDKYFSNNTEELEIVKIVKPEALPTLEFEQTQNCFRRTFFHFRGRVYQFFYDFSNKNLYNSDNSSLIRLKFLLLNFYSPIVNLIRFVVNTVRFFFTATKIIYELARDCRINKELFDSLIERSEDFYKIPYYGLLLYFFIFYGLINPFEGRIKYNNIERLLVRQKQNTHIKNHFYSAYCFNPLANVEMTDQEKIILRLKRYVLLNSFEY